MKTHFLRWLSAARARSGCSELSLVMSKVSQCIVSCTSFGRPFQSFRNRLLPSAGFLEGCRAHRLAEFSIEAEADLRAQQVSSSKRYTDTCLMSFLRASAQLPLQSIFRYSKSELEIFSAQHAELLRPSPSTCSFKAVFRHPQYPQARSTNTTMPSASIVPSPLAHPELNNKQKQGVG